MIRLLVWATLFVLIAPAAMADPIKSPVDAVRWLHKRLYPSQYVTPAPETKPAPRPRVKRGFKKTPPPVTEAPQTETAPRVTPAPPRARPKAGRSKPIAQPQRGRSTVTRTAGISARDCARLRAAYAQYGNLINMGGQGYSPAQVAYARRQCGV